ncbi:MAG TPA: AAA family ATPase [Gemmatimonadales bacterium]|nr:AAA family ATPase [Gemmatimonadales bacterium]
MIRCRTLGAVAIDVDGRPAPAELLWRKHLALLVYLARSNRRTRTREHLVGLLWPDKDERAARHSLNEALRVLRRVLGGAALDTSAGQVRLAPGDPWLDVDELESRAAARDWAAAAALVAGDFMEGFALADASGFEDWLASQRSHWRSRSIHVLLARSDELERTGHSRDAVAPVEQALALDPNSDRAVRAVMRTRTLSGDRSIALERYATFAEQLRAVGAVPEAETDRLAERIRRARQPIPAAAMAKTGESRRAPLIGRASELARLLELAEGSAGGARAVLGVVEGDAGSGKSRLLDEVVSRSRLNGALVAGVRAVPADQGEPFGGLVGLARAGLLEGRGLAAAAPSAIAAFAREIPEWMDRFPAARDADPATPAAAFIEVLRACTAEQPVLLVVDDAHQVDEGSIRAVDRALRDLASAPLAVLMSVPPHSAGTPLDELRTRLGRHVEGAAVRLGPLTEFELRELVRWALPSYDGPAVERLARRLGRDSAGLPLLAVELVHAVAQGLDLGAVEGAWPNPLRTLTETLPGDLPDAVRAAVRVGFRRLSPDAQRVLTALSVLEDRVARDRLARAADLPAPTADTALDELEWARWITADPRGYAFVARVVREVVAEDMTTTGQQQRIRERAGPLSD